MARRPKRIHSPDLATALRLALDQGAFAPPEACRVIRALEGWSQENLAERLGVNVKVIKSIESGNGNPRYDSLARIAAAANLRVAFVSESQSVELMDPRERAVEERQRRQADAQALASGLVSERELHERNALRIDELSFKLPSLE